MAERLSATQEALIEKQLEATNTVLVNPNCKKAEKCTARFRFLSPINATPPNAELISRITNQTTKCLVKEQGKGEYEISYQPRVGGAHQLHIRVGGEDVGGSPFPVAVKTPIDKLGTHVRTIERLKSPRGLAINKSRDGEVIVAEEMAGVVSIFSPTGDKLRTLDTRDMAVGGMKRVCGVAVDSEDNILVVDNGNRRLLKFSRGGDLIAVVGNEGDGPVQFRCPMGLCVNSVNGKVYVVDNNAQCVHILNSDLTFSSIFGCHGSENGQFHCPWDIASDRSGSVYVADTGNARVQVFTPDGGYLRQFGKRGRENGELDFISSICVDSDDLVYLAEYGNHCILVFTSEGKFLKSFGQGQFDKCFGMAVDQCGVVYVSDLHKNRMKLFY